MARTQIELSYRISTSDELTGSGSISHKTIIIDSILGRDLNGTYKVMEEFIQGAFKQYKDDLKLPEPQKCCAPGDEPKCKCHE